MSNICADDLLSENWIESTFPSEECARKNAKKIEELKRQLAELED